jgi:hypothetical protein
MEETNTLEITRGTATWWQVRYIGPHRAKIVGLLNTDTLPLPFTEEANAETVLAEVSRLNPDCRVYIGAGLLISEAVKQ